MKRTRNIAFIVELLILFVILLFVIVTITRTFMASRSQSLHARQLTEAVTLAESIAEVTRGLPDQDSAAALLGDMEEVQKTAVRDEHTLDVSLLFTGEKGRQDPFEAEIIREEEESAAGRFVTEQIRMYYGGETEPVYELETGWYQENGVNSDES